MNLLINAKSVHFIGIGGISMSALAKILRSGGYQISGSDVRESNITRDLAQNGILVSVGHAAQNIPKHCDLCVYTAAIAPENPELLFARENNIPAIERSSLLGLIMKRYDNAICVAGTHGKTTTTSMLSVILLEYGLNPTITVGGELSHIGGNLHIGSHDYFITEACEYVDSFLKFFPKIAIFTNIEEDHLDYFKDIHQIIGSFHAFAQKVPADGCLAVNCDDPNVMQAISNISCPVRRFSVQNKDADYFADAIVFDSFGFPSFDLWIRGQKFSRVTLNVPGIHNVCNALSVLTVCDHLGLDLNQCIAALKKFTGTKRRFEKKGMFHGALVLDDYAHHPTEIRATLQAVKNIRHHETWCVFQPHTYTRTKMLFHDFSRALSGFDHVIVTDIYAAREKDPGDIHAKDLTHVLKNAVYLQNFDQITEYLAAHADEGDIVITMGAGDVYKVGENLLEAKPLGATI